MPEHTCCPKCDSSQIIKDTFLREQSGHTVDVIAHSNPEAKNFKKGTHQFLRAMVCGACGYVEFSIKEPRGFYAKYREKKG